MTSITPSICMCYSSMIRLSLRKPIVPIPLFTPKYFEFNSRTGPPRPYIILFLYTTDIVK